MGRARPRCRNRSMPLRRGESGRAEAGLDAAFGKDHELAPFLCPNRGGGRAVIAVIQAPRFSISHVVGGTLAAASFPAQRQAAEAGDDGHVEAKVVPAARVVRLIDPYRLVEKMSHERDGGDPAVPDPHKEVGGLFRVVFAVAG